MNSGANQSGRPLPPTPCPPEFRPVHPDLFAEVLRSIGTEPAAGRFVAVHLVRCAGEYTLIAAYDGRSAWPLPGDERVELQVSSLVDSIDRGCLLIDRENGEGWTGSLDSAFRYVNDCDP